MKVSKLSIFCTSAIIQLSIIYLILTPSICHSRSIIVDSSGAGEFTRINDAINIAYSGDLIIVKSGYYNEAITVNKNIELTGDGPQHTKITSSTDGIAVQNGVTAKITGFTITAAHNGILVSAYAKVDIRNNYIIGNGSCGIYSYNANNSITNVINNVIAYNGSSGIWFHMTSCLRNITINVISNIVVSNKNYGLYLSANDSCCYATLSHNDVYDNYPSNYREKEIGYGDISINPGFMDPG